MRKETLKQREERLKKQREYNQKNREHIRKLISENQKSNNWKERIKTSYTICECGSEIQTVHKLIHIRSNKHQHYLSTLNGE